MRVGIVGLGRIGHLFGVSRDGDPLCHSEAFARVEGATIAWGMDPDADRRARFVQRFPGAAAGERAPDGGVDVVCVCSPTEQHDRGVALAIERGARVIVCEKPIAPALPEARAIVERVRAAGRTLLVNYTRRFTPMLELLRAEVQGGLLRGQVAASIRYTGGLVHNGTHWIDLGRALFGEITAARALGGEALGADRPRTIELSFAGARTLTLVGLPITTYSVGEGELLGAEGVVRFADGGATIDAAPVIDSPTWPGYRAIGPARTLTTEGLRGHFLELARHAAELLRGGATPRCTGEDGLSALAALEMALGSAS